jgi:hypothetical protein
MKRLLLILFGLVATLPALAQDNFPDVPETHEALRWMLQLKQEGFSVGDSWLYGRATNQSKEVAKILIATIDKLPSDLSRMQADALKNTACKRGLLNRIEFFARTWKEPFVQAIGSLRKEIGEMGNDPDKLIRQVEKSQLEADRAVAALMRMLPTQGFRDVPASHWAWRAVQELRDAGILVGYPDGSLRG